MKEVSIVQRQLPHYRVDFFNGLKKALESEGVRLQLIYGSSNKTESLKKDEADLDWAIKINNISIKFGSVVLYWQPCNKYLKNSDLIIVEQANKNLLNYWLLITKRLSNKKIGFWGHGLNLQDTHKSFGNRFKLYYMKASDWWFAYTMTVKRFLVSKNYNEHQITIVQNAINTREIVETYDFISDQNMIQIKESLAIESNNIAIYCGGIYKEKRISFLIESAILIRESIPDFHLIIVGSGPDVTLLNKLIKGKSWIHFMGPKFGTEKIILLKISKVFLMPGLVGLAILDSFATKTPLVTTDFPFHSPEIEYLIDTKNGIISENNVKSYVMSVINVLKNNDLLNQLKNGCSESSKKYTLEAMIDNFKNGIVSCLNAKL